MNVADITTENVEYFFNKAANECSPLIGIFIEKPFDV